MACVNDFETLLDILTKAKIPFEEGKETVLRSKGGLKYSAFTFFLITLPTGTVLSFDNTGKLKKVYREGDELE